ncbi:hypothetical protein [Nocardia abscessus]|uniref:hypothetical protein n=1 Tax=Nocardia abscessus TaxID=120957 RepID=UPI0012FAF669|nr:hypothetical protein [Nocardia abscessus]MCC3331562.1 hypothetical protein [Nocardia abscessus]
MTGTYDITDLETDLAALGEHILSQPNSSLVRTADLDAGNPFDSPEFKAAMAEHRSAAKPAVAQSKFSRCSVASAVR